MRRKKTPPEQMGQRIMERRKALGFTQESLAERCGVTPQFVSHAETGNRIIRTDNLQKIASALDVSTDYLLTGDIVDKDLLILSDKLRKLSPTLFRSVELIVDECIRLPKKK